MEILICIINQAQQFYQFSKRCKTVRIFPFNTGILILQKDVRKALLSGWYDLDLCYSQLAICTKLWNIKSIEKFLLKKENIWQNLANFYNVKLTYDFKKPIKKALYALMFGAAKKTIKSDLNNSIPPIDGDRFFKHSLIKSLYSARNKRIKNLISGEIIITLFNESLKCNGTHADARSILACEAQAMELWLLLPIVDLAQQTNEFQIMLWQHDGLSISFKDNRRNDLWLNKISNIVKNRAQEVKIITKLKITKL